MKRDTHEDGRGYDDFLFHIVIKFRDHLHFPYHENGNWENFFFHNSMLPWQQLSDQFRGIRIRKLFTSLQPGQIMDLLNRAAESEPGYQPPDLLTYFVVDCPPATEGRALLRLLLSHQNVELAYIQDGALPPPSIPAGNDFIMQRGYLDPAPAGIDAGYASKIPGGDGSANIHFIDIEQGWLTGHEALPVQMLPATGMNRWDFRDHGAAVLGVIMLRDNDTAGKGIVPRARAHVVSQWRPDGSLNNADAILTAIAHLRFGDLLLLEMQACFYDNSRLWPVEIQDASFQCIRLATALGITVVEAAANGDIYTEIGNDLDELLVDGKHLLNPASMHFRDSGATLVAAATSGVPHRRMPASNYGQRVNCYAWGEKVATAGAYPRSSGAAINTYTDVFNGTSSASAIIAGAAIALQSIRSAHQYPLLGPLQMRSILGHESFGTAPANGPSDKIGVMPDLKKILNDAFHLFPAPVSAVQ